MQFTSRVVGEEPSTFNRRAFILAATSSLTGVVAARASSAAAPPDADWRLVSSGGPPGARWDHTLSIHPDRKELLLAFGRDDSGAALGDCWIAERTSGEWQPLAATGPAPRFGHAAVTDEENGLIYFFGGQQGDQFFNELWVLDLEGNRWELMSDGSDGPSPRYGTSLVYDGAGALYVTHGFTFEGRFDDTWRFDLATARWEDSSPAPEQRPLRRCLHEAVWDDPDGSMLLYGGCSSGFGPCPQNDLWRFDPESARWQRVEISGPAGRSNPALVMDRNREQLVLFGGLTADGASNDLWIGTSNDETTRWEAIAGHSDGPSVRSSHDAVVSGGAIYLFGGIGAEGALGDLWRLRIADES